MNTRGAAILLATVISLTMTAVARCEGLVDHYARYGDLLVRYKSQGNGAKSLIFVHGWACRAEFWDRNLSEFSEYRVIALDLPGHGLSDKPHAQYSMDFFASAVAAVMRDAGIEDATIIGHSMGSGVAVRFYEQYPQRTRGLVLVDGLPWLHAMPEGVTAAQLRSQIEQFRLNYGVRAAEAVDRMLKPISDDSLRWEIRSAMLQTPSYVGISSMQGYVDAISAGNNKEGRPINVPILAIVSAASGWHPSAELRIRSIAPDLTFRSWPHASHFIMMDEPEAFNKAVRNFIAAHRQASNEMKQ